ncbi:MAG: prepilin-type N-terminal cleavage/methylation domain-containing protein [Proteobacteria bacterium]|nr:prepilin-type N-terminal cleavage/methylation domain-containing protein [Pseudomonadota bacterium]MBU1688076.1 prepilin-type N-terminal cleavage/methylation domain-containing protein [Pseudomonadota bacterium]
MKQTTPLNSGFTLIELIVVMVILGLVGVMGADFIATGFKGFAATDDRIELYEEGKTTLVRLEREIHGAVPNAVTLVSPTELRIGMIDEVAMVPVFGSYLESPPTTTLTDAFVPPPVSSATAFLPVNTIISVYNRNWTDFTTMTMAQRRLYTVTGLAAGTMTISKNMPPPRSSPRKRYYAVDRAIRYTLSGTDLLRSQFKIANEADDINTQLTAATQYPLTRNIVPGTFQFNYAPAALSRNGMVTVNFTLTRSTEQIDFHKEIHIKNVP